MSGNLIHRLKRQSGQVLVMSAFGLLVLIGVASLAVDFGHIVSEKAIMQSACDAAALAAAKELPNQNAAQQKAVTYLLKNNYDINDFEIGATCTWNPTGTDPNWYRVQLLKNVHNFFAIIAGISDGTVEVMATAEYFSMMPMNINGGGTYGTNGIMTLSVFGPYAPYSYGDAYSTKYLNNGNINPEHRPQGYDFRFTVPDNYEDINGTSFVDFQIFDPDTYNGNGSDNAGPNSVDEIRNPTGDVSSKAVDDELADEAIDNDGAFDRNTTTRYLLYAPDNTPNDFSDDVLIATAVYGPGDTDSDMQWVTPDGFSVDIDNWGTGDYRLNVKAINGSSENGFNLRATPPIEDEDDFDDQNGTSVIGLGNLPINFNGSGTVTIDLGEIPAEAAGMNLHINNFDTDVGSKDITFEIDGNSYSGTLSSNGTWNEDVIALPSNNFNGGILTATYRAGSQDTSVWNMYFEGALNGLNGNVHLVE